MNMMQHLTIERTVHIVIATFALASVSNVSSFFIATDHHPIIALLMAIALGTAVATTAIMLTMIDMVKQRGRYIAVGVMVLCLVGISGFVQMQSYLMHGLSMTVSAAMGFGIVFSGECLTAIALSLYQAAERRRKIDEADQGLELKLAQAFADTLDAVDTAKSAKYLQRHIDQIVRHKADQLVAQYIQLAEPFESLALEHPRSPHLQIGSNREYASDSEAMEAHLGAGQTMSRGHAISPKRRTDQRRAQLLDVLKTHHTGVDVDKLNKSELARALGSSTRTIQRDIEVLRSTGALNGVAAS